MGQVDIRFIQEFDVEFIQKYASDKNIADTCNVPYPYPENGGVEFVKYAIDNRLECKSIAFAIIFEERFSGIVTLNDIDKNKKICSVDYWIAYPFWNKGIGTLSVKKAISYAKEELGIKTIISGGLKRNIGTNRVLQKNNFVKTEEELMREGKFQGEVVSKYKLEFKD